MKEYLRSMGVDVVEDGGLDTVSRFATRTRTLYVRPNLSAVDQWLAIVSVRRGLRHLGIAVA